MKLFSLYLTVLCLALSSSAFSAGFTSRELLRCAGHAVESENVKDLEIILEELTETRTGKTRLYFVGGFTAEKDDGLLPHHSINIIAKESSSAISAKRRAPFLGEEPESITITVNKATLQGAINYTKHRGYGSIGRPYIKFKTSLNCSVVAQ
ncbi:MAG: hypothetical protein A2X97_11980 [Bdellovibrionales bacterium GWA1_52_35]|nr:MAG: hypothetical protein A2X97_11980 [Bdellovibrionales bacterium GWA1_52_35]HCM39048.1 hypothetical protein [Bdellovibrionales bacterium]